MKNKQKDKQHNEAKQQLQQQALQGKPDMPEEPVVRIKCACGCGTRVSEYRAYARAPGGGFFASRDCCNGLTKTKAPSTESAPSS